jgi:hypothetical protein
MIRKTLAVAALLVVVSLVVACGPKHTSGVTGRVLVSGGPPPINNVTPTARPLSDAAVRAIDTNGTVVAKATTDTDGRFKMALDPGTYRLEASTAAQVGIVVRPAAYTLVTIEVQVP